MMTYCFLASNIAGPVGGTIASILVLIIVAIVCCITVVAIGKKCKRQNVRSYNTEQVQFQTIRCPETTETTTQTGPSRPLPNTTLNTIPQRQKQYCGYVTESAHHPVLANSRPTPPYNKSCNTIGSRKAPTVAPYPHLGPYPQKKPAPYQQQAGHDLASQPPSMNSKQRSAHLHPYEICAFNSLEINQDGQPNTSVTLTSFATLPAHNPIVHASRQQCSNVGNWKGPSGVQGTFDNPSYKSLGATHGKSDHDNFNESYVEVK